MEEKSTKIKHSAIMSGWGNAWGGRENISGKYHHMLVLEIFVIFSRVCFWSLWEAGLWADGPLLWPSMIMLVLSSGVACNCRLRTFLQICMEIKLHRAFISIFPCWKYFKGISWGNCFPQIRSCVLIGSKKKCKDQIIDLSCSLLPDAVSIFFTPGLSVTLNHI